MCWCFYYCRWAKINLDWKGVTPSVQVHDVRTGDSKSIFRAARMIFRLEYKESVKCYCTEMHVGKHGITFDWLLHCMHGCHMKGKWHVKVKFWKGQDLVKPSKHKARNLREQIFLLQVAQGELGSEERKAKNGQQVGRKCNFLYTAVPSTLLTLHNHWLLLVIVLSDY